MNIKNKILSILLFSFPVRISAQQGSGGSSGQGAGRREITNPLEKWKIDNIGDLIAKVIDVALVLVGLLAVLAIIVAGYQMITAGDKKDQVTQAKNRLLWALAGLGLVLLAKIIVTIVINALGGDL